MTCEQCRDPDAVECMRHADNGYDEPGRCHCPCHECGEPCRYESRCENCEPYWHRMIAERLYEPGVGWTEKTLRQVTRCCSS